jgi:hypothetical protein
MSATMTVAEQMRARRETWFKDGDIEFLIRRPRAFDAGQAWSEGGRAEVAIRSVVGWRGVKLSDLLPGESDGDAPFEAEAFREWIGDRLDVLGRIAEEVARLIDAYEAASGEASKN